MVAVRKDYAAPTGLEFCLDCGSTKQRCSVCKGKVWFFKQVVHEDDELAHAGGNGDEWFLSCRAQAQIKLFEDAVIAHRA